MWLSSHSTHRLPSSWVPARLEASAETPSCRSPSEAKHQIRWSNGELPGAASGSSRPRSRRAGHRHPDRVADALAERTGGRLDADGVAVLGVGRRQRAPLAQVPDVVERQAVAAEQQLDVERERGVAARQDEPVAPDPGRVARVVPQVPLEQQVRRRRQAHRRAGVTRTRPPRPRPSPAPGRRRPPARSSSSQVSVLMPCPPAAPSCLTPDDQSFRPYPGRVPRVTLVEEGTAVPTLASPPGSAPWSAPTSPSPSRASSSCCSSRPFPRWSWPRAAGRAGGSPLATLRRRLARCGQRQRAELLVGPRHRRDDAPHLQAAAVHARGQPDRRAGLRTGARRARADRAGAHDQRAQRAGWRWRRSPSTSASTRCCSSGGPRRTSSGAAPPAACRS